MGAEEALSETVYSRRCSALWRTLLIQTDYINHDKNHLAQEVPNAALCRYLFEGLQHLGSLAEVFEDELQRAGHQRGVILHDQVDQDPQKRPAALVVQLHRTQLRAGITQSQEVQVASLFVKMFECI